MKIPRYERAVADKPGIEISAGGLGPKLLNVLSEHFDKRVGQMQNEEFVTHCADFDDQLREFEIEELNKTSHEADGAVQRASERIEAWAVEKKENFATYELADRFEVYAAARREGLLNRLARHQMVQEESALTDTINTMIESRSKTVYANPDEFVSELDMAATDLNQLNKPEAINDVKESLVHHALEGVLDNNPGDVGSYLKNFKKYLTQDQIEKYHDLSLQSQTRQIAIDKKAKDTAIEETQNDYINRIDELTPEEIRRSNLPPVGGGSKLFFLDLLNKRDEAIVTEKNRPYTTTNSATLAQLLTESMDPEAIPLSASEILSYIPIEDGLSIADAQSLINTTDTRKTDIFKNTETALKVQFGYEGLLTGFGSKQLGALYYNNALSEIMIFLAEEPLRGLELRNKMNEIAGPYLEQYMAEYGESQEQIDKKLRLMGVKTSPAKKIVSPSEDKKVLKWIPGLGWEK